MELVGVELVVHVEELLGLDEDVYILVRADLRAEAADRRIDHLVWPRVVFDRSGV